MTAAEALLEAFAERIAAGDEEGASQAWKIYEAATRAAIQRQLDRKQKGAPRYDLQGNPIPPR
jgi:hypothetical protein